MKKSWKAKDGDITGENGLAYTSYIILYLLSRYKNFKDPGDVLAYIDDIFKNYDDCVKLISNIVKVEKRKR